MAETIKIQVDLQNGATALNTLSQIDKAVKGLTDKPIKITVDAKGLENASKQLAAYNKATAEVARASAAAMKAEAQLINAKNRSAQATANTQKAETERTKAIAKLATEQEKTKQAEEKSMQAAAKLATAQEKTTQATERTAQANTKLAIEEQKTAQQAEKTTQAELKLTQQREKSAAAADRASKAASTGKSFFSGLASQATAYAASLISLNTAINLVRIGLEDMKDVDAELINIRKVTGMSADEANALGKASYDIGSKYGVSAADYLSSVADFSKAGYGDAAKAMGELATKTQLVGDVTADTATKFLISADAAFKFNGDVERLSSALDAANAIENNYATSIDKLAEGFPIVANVASMANMSMEETMAVLGTITAKTQESGSRAAYAWRTLVMNIVGEVGDFVTDEGETIEVTSESIKSMTDALKQYAPEVLQAAKDTGELVNPLEAIKALAQAFQDKKLNATELEKILADIGGKRYTNQLMALVTDYDALDDMLQTVAGSAGSADSEISALLEGWGAKTNQLKNSWTELLSTVVDTDFIKGLLDIGTDFLTISSDIINGAKDVKAALDDMFPEWILKVGNSQNPFYQIKSIIDGAKRDLGLIKAVTQGENPFYQNLTADEWQIQYGLETTLTPDNNGNLQKVTSDVVYLNDLQTEMASGVAYNTRIYDDYYGMIEKLSDEGYPYLTDAQKEGLELWKELNGVAEDAVDVADSNTDAISDTTKELTTESEEVSNTADKFNTLADNLAGATAALKEFDEATKTEKGDTASQYATDYAKAMEKISNGEYNSNAVLGAAELFFSEEKRAQLNYDVANYAKELSSSFYDNIFNGPNENAGANFINALYDMADGAEVVTAKINGAEKEILRFEETADGGLNFDYSSIQDLATYTGLSTDAITALLEATEAFSQTAQMGWEDRNGLLDALEQIGYKGKISANDVDGLVSALYGLSNGNFSPEELMGLLTALEETGRIDLSGVKGSLGDVISEVTGAKKASDELKDALNGASKVKIDPEVKINNLSEAIEYANQLTSSASKSSSKSSVSTSVSGQTEVDNLVKQVNTLQSKTITITANVGRAASSISDLKRDISAIPDKEIKVSISSRVRSEISDITRAIDGIPKNTAIKITCDTSSARSELSALSSSLISAKNNADNLNSAMNRLGNGYALAGRASGTTDAEGGPTLVNELGPELISANGRAWIAGNGLPVVTNVPKGAVILTAEQTADALKGGNMDYEVQAFWSGTVPRNNWSGATTTAAASPNTSASYASSTEEQFATFEDELEKELDLLDLQIKIAERQGNAAKVLQLQNTAQDRINLLINKYRGAGYSDTSKEILTLINKGYEYGADRVDVGEDLWDDMIDAIESAKDAIDESNDLTEKQQNVTKAQESLANAKAQRTVRIFNPATGQWEWIADQKSVEKAQESYNSAQEKYQDALLDQEIKRLKDSEGQSLEGITIGNAIYSMLQNAPEAEQNAFADSLKAVYGAADYTTGVYSDKNFSPSDSHDTIYNFGGITMSEQQANATTLGELARQLRVLGVT